MSKENKIEDTQDNSSLGDVSVRYFYNGQATFETCSKCGSSNINTYTSDWLRMENMNRKECQDCPHRWLVNAR